MPSRGFPRASILVLVIALAAGVAMLSGLAGGLVRIGWPLLPEHFVAPVALHSALMVCGFFGFGKLGGLVFGAVLGLLARFTLLRVQGGGAFLDPGLVEQAGNAVGRLRADAQPIADAVFDQTHAVGIVLGQQRVIGADLFQMSRDEIARSIVTQAATAAVTR